MSKILLTGSSGILGSSILSKLNEKEIFLNLINKNKINQKYNQIKTKNYNLKNLKRIAIGFKPDIIIHAAGKVGGIQANINYPLKFLTDNLEIGKNIVTASKETNIKKTINELIEKN